MSPISSAGGPRSPSGAAAEPKEWLIIPYANHVDLYDRLDKIPFDAIVRFFDANLE